MKKLILAFAAIVLSVGMANAQDLAKATEIYNNGATALSAGNKESALENFQKALQIGETIGEEAEELVTNCKKAIPGVMFSIGQDLLKSKKFDDAISMFDKAKTTAESYGDEDVALKSTMQKAGTLMMTKEVGQAMKIYEDVLDADSTNVQATMCMVQCIAITGKFDNAGKYLSYANSNGIGDKAGNIIGSALLKQSAKELKDRKFEKAIEYAVKSSEFNDNPQAFLIAGQAATKLKKADDTIKYFSIYLEKAPKAKNAGPIALTVGALYQQQKNNAKAIEYYEIAKKHGQDTQQYIDALKK